MPQKKPRAAAAPRLPINGGHPCDPSDNPFAAVNGPATVPLNGNVQLQGTAEELILGANCHLTKKPTQFSWSLFFTPPGGPQTQVNNLLNNANTLTPTFVAANFGVYAATLTAGNNRIGFDSASLAMTVFRPMVLQESTGKVTFLRVNEIGDSFGPQGDAIQVEAIIQLDSEPGMSFGFELRNDKQRPAHQGMLDVLRDAFVNDITVTIDYLIPEGNENGTIFRVWLTK